MHLVYTLLLPLSFTLPLSAADWPQWMGPNRDGVWPETGILEKFPEGGPKVLWRTARSPAGYSGPAVADGKVYVTDRVLAKGAMNPADPFDSKTEVKSTERVLCLDAKTGKEIWKHEYDCPYQISYPAGPRCTPTVHGGKVYALGAMGDLFCLDAKTGKPIWSKNFPKDYDGAGADVGVLRPPARLQGPRHLHRRRRRERGGRLRQGDRPGEVEEPLRARTGLQPADAHHVRRQGPDRHLARQGA